jgi:FlaA1/EpsC-like NDP-sugar epimerase
MNPETAISERQILERAVLGRTESLFADDMEIAADAIGSCLEGATVLIVGASGSIGRELVSRVLKQRAAKTVLVDINENGMAEVMRSVRNTFHPEELNTVVSAVFDIGSRCLPDFLLHHGQFDLVLNLAAVKHVRAERDPYSMLHLFETNIVKQMHFFKSLRDTKFRGRLFSVSTDKAADPVSAMGASKRLMEAVMFEVAADHFIATSSRFANVAFSDGSLLESFVHRLSARHPIAVPQETKRFFYSHAEAADVCMLAAVIAEKAHVLVPKDDLSFTETVLADAAVAFLNFHKYEPEFTDDEVTARDLASKVGPNGRYPVLLTKRDTGGEKSREKFIGDSEHLHPVRLPHFDQIKPTGIPIVTLDRLLERIGSFGGGKALDNEDIISAMQDALPNFQHADSRLNLDQRL